MPPDEMDDPVMRPAEAVLREDRIGLGGEIAIGEEQQLDAVAHLLLAQRKLIHPRFLVAVFYVSHVDLSGNLRYNWDVFYDNKVPRQGASRPSVSAPRRNAMSTLPLRCSNAGRFEK